MTHLSSCVLVGAILLATGCSTADEWRTVSIDELRKEVEKKTHSLDRWGYVGTTDGMHYFIRQGHAYVFPNRGTGQARKFRIDAGAIALPTTYPFMGKLGDAKIRTIFTKWNAKQDGFIFSLEFLEELGSPSQGERKGVID